jgi:hypothetical protein
MQFANNLSVQRLSQPLVGLQSNNTVISGGDFLIVLSSLKGRAKTMQKSYGSTGQSLHFDLPGAARPACATSGILIPTGRNLLRLIPNVEIPRNVQDVVGGTDATLNAALKELKK